MVIEVTEIVYSMHKFTTYHLSYRLFKKNNEEVTSIENVTWTENVTWIDTSVSAKPLLCRINEAVSRLAYLSFVIAFGEYYVYVQSRVCTPSCKITNQLLGSG